MFYVFLFRAHTKTSGYFNFGTIYMDGNYKYRPHENYIIEHDSTPLLEHYSVNFNRPVHFTDKVSVIAKQLFKVYIILSLIIKNI
jgi:hypothetical protein